MKRAWEQKCAKCGTTSSGDGFRPDRCSVCASPFPATLEAELAALLNRHSVEQHSGTPDFILAQFLMASLNAYEIATVARARWAYPLQAWTAP